MKNKSVVKIMGKNYTVCGEECPEYLETVGIFVSQKIDRLRTLYPFGSTTDIGVMAAIDIADELLKLKDEHVYMDNELTKSLKKLTSDGKK